jgi:hypothetical protein
MPPHEIPRNRWVDELDAFTVTHEGWLVSVDVLGEDIGAQREIDNMPLLGVSAERLEGERTIAISVARSKVEHVTHVIRAATRVYVERGNDGATAGLLVQSEDGTSTVLRCRALGRPS